MYSILFDIRRCIVLYLLLQIKEKEPLKTAICHSDMLRQRDQIQDVLFEVRPLFMFWNAFGADYTYICIIYYVLLYYTYKYNEGSFEWKLFDWIIHVKGNILHLKRLKRLGNMKYNV